MKMRGYYIFLLGDSLGVRKKIDMQIDIMEKQLEIYPLELYYKKRTLFRKIVSKIPFGSVGIQYEEALKQIQNPDYIYIRRILADREYINFLRTIKKRYPNCKLILEIFTYPYDKDAFNRNFKHMISQLPYALKDKYNRKKLKKYIDRIVTYTDDDVIFEIQTIKTTNGVRVETIDAKKSVIDDVIDIVSVAHMQPHHGFERLLEGMYMYYKQGGNRKIKYHVIGDGEEVLYYRHLVEKYSLQDRVIFVGKLDGEELSQYYNRADIALASLGGYKIGIQLFSSLKIYEYLAKGLPIISGCKINILNEISCPYVCYFNNDSSALDVRKIISFYDEIYKNGVDESVFQIRNYAYKHVDMRMVMNPIIEYIMKG